MNGEKKINLSRKVTVRFKPAEYKKVNNAFKQTTKRKLSEYIRFVLLDMPVTVYTRSKSQDELLAEFVLLRSELSAIGNNFNQLVKRLHTASHSQEIKTLFARSEIEQQIFLQKVGEINSHIAQLSDKWLLK